MKDTSECVTCINGELVKCDRAPKYYIYCKTKNKKYQYGQRLDCVDYERKDKK